MEYYNLFTYRDNSELRRIMSERVVYPFMFAETKDLLEDNPDVCIDISSLIYLLRENKSNIHPALYDLRPMRNETKIIIYHSLAEDALQFLPHLFFDHIPYFESETPIESLTKTKEHIRQTIYKYNNEDELNRILEYADDKKIPIATFFRANGDMREEFESFNKATELCLLDLTSYSYALENGKNMICLLEQFLCAYPNIQTIIQTPQVDTILKYFPLFFCDQKPVADLIPELDNVGQEKEDDEQIRKITDLSEEAYYTFCNYFTHNLIGHENFKNILLDTIRKFVVLNRVGEQKVLSIFLFGASGIGKTEVARLMADGLKKDSYLPKINFQNYSSQDALNSLIGSPAGYVGCNHGELSEKINKSKVGVLLCDEFEKTTRPVFSFFLELLEEGRFTDSMAREYDLNGYIIIFTSNIQNEEEYKKVISPELQTRFDIVCEFQEQSNDEKREFLDLLLEKAMIKFSSQFSQIKMTDEDKQDLYAFDYSKLHALRDIKRLFNNRLIKFFSEKGLKIY